jgi:hypothetical protein
MPSATPTTTASAANLFDPSLYPRTYRVSMRNRVVYIFLGALVAAFGFAGAVYFGTGHETKSTGETAMLVAVCFAFVALGVVLILYMLTTKVVLAADAIELRDFLQSRKLRYEDIAGRRMIAAHSASTLVLLPKRAGAKRVKITQLIQMDSLSLAWLSTLPDLDAEELAKSAAEIAASRDLGRTPEERAARLAGARKIAKALGVLSGAAAVWTYFFPEPYEVAIAAVAAIPLFAIALVLRDGRLYQVVGRNNDARANLSVAFIVPAVVLALRAVLDIQLLEWTPACLVAVAVAMMLTFVIALRDAEVRKRRWELAAMLIISVAYAYGAVVEGDVLFDISKPQIFQAQVLDKHKSSGKTTTYHLKLTPWGPKEGEDDVTVSSGVYAAAATGERVCIVLRRGALEMPWFVVAACDRRSE